MGKANQSNAGIARLFQETYANGKVATFGGGINRPTTVEEPYFYADGIPVYHSSRNQFPAGRREPDTHPRVHNFGYFYDPGFVPGMPSVGGAHGLFVGTHWKGWYTLWLHTKLDSWAFGPTPMQRSLVAWTPKVAGDNVIKAGFRLAWITAMEMSYVKPEQYAVDQLGGTIYDSEDSTNWVHEADATDRCLAVLGATRITTYNHEYTLESALEVAPDYLKPYITFRARTKSEN